MADSIDFTAKALNHGVWLDALALQGGWQVLGRARNELAQTVQAASHDHPGHSH